MRCFFLATGWVGQSRRTGDICCLDMGVALTDLVVMLPFCLGIISVLRFYAIWKVHPCRKTLARIICDRLLRLPEIPWNERMKKSRMKGVASPSQKEETSSQLIKPPRPFEDYCSEFEHPAYGTLSVKNEKGQLSASFHELVSPLIHMSSDVFEMKNEAIGNIRFFFVVNESGASTTVAVPFEPAMKNIYLIGSRNKTSYKAQRQQKTTALC